MPELSRFYGIIVTIYFNDHPPPHFYAKYGQERVKVDIATGTIIDGQMSRRALRLVEEWRSLHTQALLGAWECVVARRTPARIAPLE